MNRRLAESFMLAIRLYHSAIEQMYTEPEFAYVFLVMSIEAISSIFYENDEMIDKDDQNLLEEYLDSRYRGWKELCDISTSENRLKVIDMLLTNAYFSLRKFRQFVIDNLPSKFWEEEVDDAKADYLTRIIVASSEEVGKEEFSRSDKKIWDYEKIDPIRLKRTLDHIYGARSKLVHEGVRLPPTIVLGNNKFIPIEAFIQVMAKKNNNLIELDIPPLITFERLVSYSLTYFLQKQNY
jgi:hypothetical protein